MKTLKPQASQNAFQLKGSILTLTVLQLLQADMNPFVSQLSALVKSTPNFFRNAPIIIDLEKLADRHDNIDFEQLKDELRHNGLIPIGVRNGNEQQIKNAISAGLGILPNAKTEPPKPEPSKAKIMGDKNITSKLITQPVRSGQQVYAQQGDLIILASVSPGAELISDGNIHVYGTLRGRAIAGASGDISTRIFCHKLEAELISIAGYYKLHDDIKVPPSSSGIQIYLEEEKLTLCPIV